MNGTAMRIAVHDYAGHPFQVQLSRELARRGHDVLHLYCASFQSPHGDLSQRPGDPPLFRVAPISVAREINKYSPVARWRQDVEYGHNLAAGIAAFAPTVVLSANTPLASQRILLRHCRRAGVRFVFWMQDVYAAAARRVLRRKLPVVGEVIAAVLGQLERQLLRGSDAIVTITEDFFGEISAGDLGKTVAIPNWAPIADLPQRPKDNAWSRAHGLHDKFCFLYTGTLGFKHNPGLLLGLAKQMTADPSVRVVVVSEGMGADWLRGEIARTGVANLTVLAYQPFDAMPDMLASADVLVGVLEKEAGQFSVPSKVLTYLCAARPLLLSVPADNLAARTVAGSGAGIVVPPDDDTAFCAEALKLKENAALRTQLGAAARRYAEQHFEIGAIADRFLTTLASRTASRAQITA